MTLTPDVTPVFVINTAAPPGNVVPLLSTAADRPGTAAELDKPRTADDAEGVALDPHSPLDGNHVQHQTDSGGGLHPHVGPAARQVPRRAAGGNHQTGRPRRLPVVEWFTDEAITGDSSTDARPGLAALLSAAKAGKFKLVLAWHTNRISREDPMDAIVFYNQLRKAGVGLHTCCEGPIDLEDFAKQLLLFVNQKASNDFLIEMSAKTLRGRIANAKAGGHNGGPAVFAMDRGLFDEHGNLVRRLQPGEYIRQAGHRVRLLPCTDQAKIDAVQLCLQPFRRCGPWRPRPCPRVGSQGLIQVRRARAGHTTTWADCSEPRPMSARPNGARRRGASTTVPKAKTSLPPAETARTRDGSPRKTRSRSRAPMRASLSRSCSPACKRSWQRRERKPSHRTRHFDYPLTGLIVCEHCGKPMCGNSLRTNDRTGEQVYRYQQYVCATYAGYGRDCRHNTTCGRNAIDANRVLRWIVHKLQEVFLGPGRGVLVEEIKRQLAAEVKTTPPTWRGWRNGLRTWTGKSLGWSRQSARPTRRNWSRN